MAKPKQGSPLREYSSAVLENAIGQAFEALTGEQLAVEITSNKVKPNEACELTIAVTRRAQTVTVHVGTPENPVDYAPSPMHADVKIIDEDD